jgi:DNA-binding GntR family transcriptional regulator
VAASDRASAQGLPRVTQRPKLADEIVDTLRQALLSGTYPVGAKLGLEELADQLGVSVMPVREALISLANEGLVKAEPRRGFQAQPLAPGDLSDVFELHAHLAGILAGRAAEIATPEDVAFLRGQQHALELLAREPTDSAILKRAGDLNTEFHRYINKMPSGDRLRWFLRSTNRLVRSDLFEFASPGIFEASITDHPPIIAAIENHDSELARKLTEAHFQQGAHLTGCVAPRSL